MSRATQLGRALAVAWLLCPGTALAHSPVKGIGHFYNGVLHPLFVPAQLLAVLSLGLLLGQQWPRGIQWAVATFLVATALGLAAAGLAVGLGMETLLLIGAASVGVLTAIRPRVPIHLCAVIALFIGLATGLDHSREPLADETRALTLAGSGMGLVLLFSYALALAEYFKKQAWQRVGIRVLASWIAASAFLALSLSLVPGKSDSPPTRVDPGGADPAVATRE